MDDFETACRSVLVLEGGYVNNPNDPGGETMYGITVAVARAHGYAGAMRDLPLSTARAIFRAEYWAPLHLDEVAALSVTIATELFDTNVNFYRGAAASFLQRSLSALGLLPPGSLDGKIGPTTIAALKRFLEVRGRDGHIVLMRMLNGLQLADYVRQVEAQPGKREFLFGWIRARIVI